MYQVPGKLMGNMKFLAVLLSWLGVASAFLLSQAPGPGIAEHHRVSPREASSTSTSTHSRGLATQHRCVSLGALGTTTPSRSPPTRSARCISLAASASSTSSKAPPSGDEDAVVQFRAALPEEDGAIRRILAGMLMNPMSIDVKNFVCAEKEGLLVGFGQVRSIGGSKFELASLHIAEPQRCRGIGSSLVRQLINQFVETHGPEKLEDLYLLTLKDTTNFYQKLGFDVIPPEDAPPVLRAERAQTCNNIRVT